MSKNNDAQMIRVLDASGTELRPTANSKKVRKLLQSKQAEIACYDPFTIRLLRDPLGVTAPETPAKEENMNIKNQTANEADGVIICENADKTVTTADLNQNILAMGKPESNKMESFTLPLLYQLAKEKHSFIVTDPHGYCAEELTPYLEANGYSVRHIHFPDDVKGNTIPLTMHQTDRESKLAIHKYAMNLIVNLPGIFKSIYELGCTVLLESLLLRVTYGHEFPAHEKNLQSVYKVLMHPDGIKYVDSLFDRKKLNSQEACASEVYRTFLLLSENLRSETCAALCFALRNYLLAHPEVSAIEIGTIPERAAFFVETVRGTEAYQPMVRDAVQSLFLAYVDKANDSHLMTLDTPVHLVLDCAYHSVGNMPILKEAVLRNYKKRNIFVSMTVNGVDELKSLLGSDWENTADQFDLVMQFGQADRSTLDFLTKERKYTDWTDVKNVKTVVMRYSEETLGKMMDGFAPVLAFTQNGAEPDLVHGFAVAVLNLPFNEDVRKAKEQKDRIE